MGNKEFEKMALVHDHRLSKGRTVLGESTSVLDNLSQRQHQLNDQLSELDALLSEADSLLSATCAINEHSSNQLQQIVSQLEKVEEEPIPSSISVQFEQLDTIPLDDDDTLESLSQKYQDYAIKHSLDLNRNIATLLSHEDIATINKRLEDEFTYKNAKCDKYDYMIAGTAGLLGAIIDIFFVGAPGEGFLTKVSDKFVDNSVQKFASSMGWKGAREGKDPTKSAIAFLERKYPVNYDHRHGGDVDWTFPMSTKNHHIKSLGHHPDLIGLFFSILSQFISTAHFVHGGKIISINTDTFELSGGNFIAKIFAGFTNWLGHLFSDVAGSSGADGRGSGIPIPFFGILQFVDIGAFGQHRQTFATICVKVFEQGYDFRHGMTMAIPVIITELLIRLMFFVKQFFYHKKDIQQAIPSASIPELRRMLLVGHGTLCLIDAGDAALRSGGEIVNFLLRTNIIAWTRFGFLALKELNAFMKQGRINVELMDEYIDKEYREMMISFN